MTANLGTAVGQAGAGATPSGIAMTGLGTVTAVPGQEIVSTGFPVEARLSSAFTIVIHVDVQVTGFDLTMNQGSGSALIWNEVNTGSAPITPPGWQYRLHNLSLTETHIFNKMNHKELKNGEFNIC